jgi:hypothetical protein
MEKKILFIFEYAFLKAIQGEKSEQKKIFFFFLTFSSSKVGSANQAIIDFVNG